MSASGFVVAAAVGAPLVMEAGLTPATAATAGLMNCPSRNARDVLHHVVAHQPLPRTGLLKPHEFLGQHDDPRRLW